MMMHCPKLTLYHVKEASRQAMKICKSTPDKEMRRIALQRAKMVKDLYEAQQKKSEE